MSERRAEIKISGTVDAEDLRLEWRTMLAAPGFERRMDLLWDFSEAHFSGELERLKEFARRHERREGDEAAARIAIIARSDHLFGMARLFATLAGWMPPLVGVFRNADAARSWLELETTSGSGSS